MKLAIFISVVVGLVLIAEGVNPIGAPSQVPLVEEPAINPALIERINSKSTTWQAGVNENFKGWKLSHAKKLMGWKPNPNTKLPRVSFPPEKKANLPDNFDSATAWPKCTTIATIYDQARCGSCWAFGCVEAVQDRFCIHSAGSSSVVSLSFEDEVCCGPDDGCEGGDAGDAWQYVQDSGLVTSDCSPYTVPTCPPAQEPCLDFVNTPPCVQSCSDSESWTNSLHFNSNTYSVSSDQTDIMTEIMTNGPVEACFSVYADFLNYKTGVYQYDGQSQFLGGHCIKVRGWGVENGTPYWLCNNSWTTTWGDSGQFKILRGSDECGIEDDMVAGMPSSSK